MPHSKREYQCRATTKRGRECSRSAEPGRPCSNRLCWQHCEQKQEGHKIKWYKGKERRSSKKRSRKNHHKHDHSKRHKRTVSRQVFRKKMTTAEANKVLQFIDDEIKAIVHPFTTRRQTIDEPFYFNDSANENETPVVSSSGTQATSTERPYGIITPRFKGDGYTTSKRQQRLSRKKLHKAKVLPRKIEKLGDKEKEEYLKRTEAAEAKRYLEQLTRTPRPSSRQIWNNTMENLERKYGQKKNV